ncbi:MAG: TSUP family transporter [Microthrixaceae bacterium]
MTGGQLALILLASAIGATVKSVTGMGYPLIAVPLISLALGVEDAVVIVAAPNLAANVFLCWESREGRSDARDLDRLIGVGVVGAVIGTIALVNLPDAPLLLALAATIVVFVVQFVRRPELRLDPAVARRWSPLVGLVAGLAQGAVGVSGPVVATWMHGYRLPVRVYIFSVTLIFGVTGAVQLSILVLQGKLTADLLLGALVGAIAVAVCTPIGLRVRSRLAGATFDRVVLAVLVVSAVSLVYDALG